MEERLHGRRGQGVWWAGACAAKTSTEAAQEGLTACSQRRRSSKGGEFVESSPEAGPGARAMASSAAALKALAWPWAAGCLSACLASASCSPPLLVARSGVYPLPCLLPWSHLQRGGEQEAAAVPAAIWEAKQAGDDGLSAVCRRLWQPRRLCRQPRPLPPCRCSCCRRRLGRRRLLLLRRRCCRRQRGLGCAARCCLVLFSDALLCLDGRVYLRLEVCSRHARAQQGTAGSGDKTHQPGCRAAPNWGRPLPTGLLSDTVGLL